MYIGHDPFLFQLVLSWRSHSARKALSAIDTVPSNNAGIRHIHVNILHACSRTGFNAAHNPCIRLLHSI